MGQQRFGSIAVRLRIAILMINSILPSFNAGELSPRLWSRTDLDKYASGCRVLENFIVMPYGGINRRPGSMFMGEVKDSTKKVRLIGFNFSVTTNFILEFGDGYIRFWSNGQQVMVSGSPYEIASPYAQNDLFQIQCAQINDVMYLAHANYPVYKLSRVADANWTMQPVAWSYPPFRQENISATTITASATSGTGITLVASAAVFDSGDVGGFYQIGWSRDSSTIAQALNSDGTSSPIRILGDWSFLTTGIWQGTVNIQRSTDNGSTWITIRSYPGDANRNITASGTQETDALFRVVATGMNGSVASGNPTAYLEAVNAIVYGVVKITAVTDSQHATADVLIPLGSTSATTYWSEGAWSTRRGFPRTVCMHQQRLFFGGNLAESQTVWGSVLGDFENFLVNALDDSSLQLTVASNDQTSINWLNSYRQDLMIGTSGEEYVLQPTSQGSALTPTNLDIRRQSNYGSAYLPAILVNNATLYVQRHGRKFLEAFYNWQIDGFISQDLNLMSDHVTHGGVVQHAFQQILDSIVWIVTGDGILAGMTYDRNQNVVSWHRHTTDGVYESVARIYGGTTADEIWVVVNRTINGVQKRYVERFDPSYRDIVDNADKTNWFYVDCGKTVNPTGLTISGLGHLEGKTVSVLTDGSVHPDCVVTGGIVTLNYAASVVQLGLAYTSTLQPTALDLQMQGGTAQGRHFRIHRLAIRFYNSLGGEVQTSPGVWDVIASREAGLPMDRSPSAFSGQKELMVSSDFSTSADITIRQRQPLPMTILALLPKWDVYGD